MQFYSFVLKIDCCIIFVTALYIVCIAPLYYKIFSLYISTNYFWFSFDKLNQKLSI